MIPIRWFYKLGYRPWERRNVEQTWEPILRGPDALEPGKALDIGCGSGRDAIFLARSGWSVTALDSAPEALDRARKSSAEMGVDVGWVDGDASALGNLGIEPGYDLIYDLGCMHMLSDGERQRAARGITELSAEGATLVVGAFMAGRRRLLFPRGIDEAQLSSLLGPVWQLQTSRPMPAHWVPPPVRIARPTYYRFKRVR